MIPRLSQRLRKLRPGGSKILGLRPQDLTAAVHPSPVLDFKGSSSAPVPLQVVHPSLAG